MHSISFFIICFTVPWYFVVVRQNVNTYQYQYSVFVIWYTVLTQLVKHLFYIKFRKRTSISWWVKTPTYIIFILVLHVFQFTRKSSIQTTPFHNFSAFEFFLRKTKFTKNLYARNFNIYSLSLSILYLHELVGFSFESLAKKTCLKFYLLFKFL